MSNAIANRIRYDTLRSLAYTSISGAYMGVGTAFGVPVRILKVTNTTDADLLVSFDGVNDNDVIAASSAWIHDYCSNRSDQSGFAEQSVGDRVYVKEASGAPTKGDVYVTVIYVSAM